MSSIHTRWGGLGAGPRQIADDSTACKLLVSTEDLKLLGIFNLTTFAPPR